MGGNHKVAGVKVRQSTTSLHTTLLDAVGLQAAKQTNKQKVCVCLVGRSGERGGRRPKAITNPRQSEERRRQPFIVSGKEESIGMALCSLLLLLAWH